MAISISSLTPTTPTAPEGGVVNFVVVASDSNGETLSYEWQFSNNAGASYTSSGLVGNTSDSYTTSQLTSVQNGLYWRVVITNQSGDVVNSDEDPGIGDRILVVTTAPAIVVLTEPDTSIAAGVGVDVSLAVEMSLSAVDQTVSSNFANVTVQWQKSTDDGNTWSNINNGDFDGTITNYGVVTDNAYDLGGFFGVRSVLSILDTTFGISNYQYRAQIAEPSASNSPVNVPATLLVINPIITIYSHPGDGAGDTTSTNCYKTSIANSGEATFTVGALTTAGSGLGYAWEFSYLDANGDYTDFLPIADGISEYFFSLVTGTASNTSTLQLTKLIYFEEFRIRCVVSGSSTEPAVTTNSHSILMTDVVTNPENILSVTIGEDYYGDVSNRSALTDYPIQTAQFVTEVNTSKNTGLNGNVTMVFQRKDPGASTWSDVGITVTKDQDYGTYYSAPATQDPTYFLDLSYDTPPVRIADDDGAEYRAKVTSTAVYTLDANNNKVLTPIYSNTATLSVFRQIFVLSQPGNATVYPTFSASFSISAIVTSTATITYQWQKSSDNSTWTDITASNAGTTYTGYTTNLLTIASATSSLDEYYRCIVNAAESLSSVTSSSGELILEDDLFTILSNLNDYYVNEFVNVEWQVTAQSLSLGTVSYQWQKSTNYNNSNPSAATWSNISGETTDTLSLLSVTTANNEGYYRCKVTSQGGYVDYTNAVVLDIFTVAIGLITDVPSSYNILEGASQAVTFLVEADSTIGASPTYQWQRSTDGTTWTNFGTGYQGQSSASNSFIPPTFAKSEDGLKIRCKIDSADVPTSAYSSVATLNIIRRFSYFADSATKSVADGAAFVLDLNPVVTGGTPTYQWYAGSSPISGQTSQSLSITASAANNNTVYKCLIGLTDCDQHRYDRNNVDNIVSATSSTFTVTVTLSITSTGTGTYGDAIRYTTEGIKSGAAIGTVICIPKPSDYVHSSSQTTNDNAQWKHATTGSVFNTSANSTETSGSAYTANKPSWVTTSGYVSPRWKNTDDRFPGYIELRGQWVKKKDFPALYRVIGDAYGVTSDKFRLPMPIGKKLMGTGNVDNNSGSTSIVPLFGPDGNSGGDKNVPGTIGGQYNYNESEQLPPGSPGVGSLPDGTAGSDGDPLTFTLGNFSTNGFEAVEGIGNTTFTGKYKFKVGPLLPWAFGGVPTHSHGGIGAGYEDGYKSSSGSCNQGNGGGPNEISPKFYELEAEGASVANGPAGIPETSQGTQHNHALSKTTINPTNNADQTHADGIGPIAASDTLTETINLEFVPNSTAPSFNLFMEPAPINMTNATKALFDGALKFTLQNNEGLPILSPYFRLKYLIKAY